MIGKKLIAGILILAIISGSALIAPFVTGGSGYGQADVLNAAAEIQAVTPLTPAWIPMTSLSPNVPMYCNVTVRDVDNVSDISNVTMELVYWGTWDVDDPTYYYRFFYDNTTDTWSQILPNPLNVTYIDLVSCTKATLSNTIANFSFAFMLNKTAQDTNGVLRWRTRASVYDNSGILTVGSITEYVMNPFIEINYWGNAGPTDFIWSGTAESNQTIQFNTLVTSNDPYWLNASYNGSFQLPWGEPTLWIAENANPALQLPDWEITSTNVTWYFAPAGFIYYMHNETHFFSLEFPPGIQGGVSYTGVTIWIEAIND
jgi:hypothetical protein